MIRTKRVYEPAEPGDGKRFLIDRLWPRGIKKEALQIEAWLKEIAPSDALRKWYAHDPKKWEEFKRRYFEVLDSNPASWKGLLEIAEASTVTLLYSSKETRLNNATALKEFLEKKLATFDSTELR
ncbi:MAG TPA: DUF488 domain-containing protein [bacterium]